MHQPSHPTVPIDPSWIMLIVDDDAVSRRIVMEYLAKTGIKNRIIEAEGGLEAIAILEDVGLRPVLVLLDVEMPAPTGLGVLRWIRSAPRLAGVPVVMLTGSSELDQIDEAYELGIATYLVKPVGFAALTEALRNLNLPSVLLPPPVQQTASPAETFDR